MAKVLMERGLVEISPAEETVFYKFKTLCKPAKLLNSKQIYWQLNTQTIQVPTCQTKWLTNFFFDFTETRWKNIFTLAKSLTKNSKLIEFQFKIIHRVYASDSYVANFDITVNKVCQLCNVTNNIVHQFVDCESVKIFWQLFKAWLTHIEGYNIILNSSDIIFGVYAGLSYRLNFSLLHAKWYIHLKKQSNHPVIFEQFMTYFNSIIIIEHQIAVNRKREFEFNKLLSVFQN